MCPYVQQLQNILMRLVVVAFSKVNLLSNKTKQ
jgi:hypothetical protein